MVTEKMTEDMKMSLQAVSQDCGFSVLSAIQLQKVDGLLSKLQDLHNQKQLNSVLTSDVIELYEYKLESMRNAERVASEHCISVQHRNAQLTAELNKSHQMLHHVQQCHEKVTEAKDNLADTLESSKKQFKEDISELKAVNKELEEELTSVKGKFQDLKKKHEKLRHLIKVFQENIGKLEERLRSKCTALKTAEEINDSQILEINDLKVSLTQIQEDHLKTITELTNVKKELKANKEALETITKVDLSSRELNQ